MSRAIPIGLAAMAVMLALTLVIEYRALRPETTRSDAASLAPIPAAQIKEANQRPEPTQKLVSIVLGRPLFSDTRRPPPGTGINAPGLARLSGVIVDGSHRRAIFSAPSGAKSVVVNEGARVGAYVVRSIGIGQVVVAKSDETIILRPTFDANLPDRTAMPTSSAALVAAPPFQPGQPLPPARSLIDQVRAGTTQ